MNIQSAKFLKSVVGPDVLFEDGRTQIAFIGRSNCGKSSTINALTKQGGLAKTSAFPGRTQQMNVFLVNQSLYFVDLPGYGFTKTSAEGREKLQQLIHWYLLNSRYEQKKVVLIVDANVGLTREDSQMLYSLEEKGKDIIIAANKIDKIKKSEYVKKLQKIQDEVGEHEIVPYSAEKNIGVKELVNAILA